ncbi:unnamed protein product [Phytophthora fragariaefolia]|uniref:Unnamed protein product n=1 Tax=Phytophthora fragariaefolia TaxID=1490495 RepID=A0A9W6YAF6_9STRA|nr:unnamed protein product [Phytophthora fragariaefolia]
MLDISGINSLSATSLSGTLQTAAQPNITSVGTLSSISTSGALTMSGVSISSSEISVLDGAIAGTAQASKVLVLTVAQTFLVLHLCRLRPLLVRYKPRLSLISRAQWGALGVQYQSRATTYTDTSSLAGSTVASSVISSYAQTTIASTNSITITRAATVYIENAPAQGTNTSIRNSYSLWIASGKVLFGDTTASSSTTTGALVVSGGVGVAGQLTASTIAGTIQTAAQPNITSIGTLSSLTVSGGLSASTLTGTLQTASQPNITSVGALTSLSVAGGLSASTLAGTLQTAAQPNITSIGTLTSLTVSGSIDGTLSTAAQPNSTSLGKLTNLNVRSGATTGEIANISMPAQAAGYCSWITIGKSSSGNEGGRIVYYHDSTFANQYLYITHNNKSPFFVLSNNSCVGINTLTPTYDLDLVGQARITGTLLFAGASRSISNVLAYSGGTITTSGDISCGGSLKGYLGYGNQSTISTVGVLTEVAIGSTGVYNSQEYLLIHGNESNYLDGSYTRMCSFYGSNVTPAWFQIEVSTGSKTVSTSATWIGNNSDTDLRLGVNNSTYAICLGGTNRGRWGFGTTSPAYGLHNTLTVSSTIDPSATGVAYFLRTGGLVSTIGPLSAIPVGIGTVGAILAGSGVYTTSDARLKKDWTELCDDVCDAMLRIKPSLFRYKSDDDTIPLQIGYRAQDLIRVGLPHCINFVPNKDMHIEDAEVDTEGIQASSAQTYLSLDDKAPLASQGYHFRERSLLVAYQTLLSVSSEDPLLAFVECAQHEFFNDLVKDSLILDR